MNAVRIREDIKAMAGTILLPQAAQEFATAPLFQFTDTIDLREDELEWCRNHLCEGELRQVPTKLPFPVFTVHRTLTTNGEKDGIDLLVWGHRYPTKNGKGEPITSILTVTLRTRCAGHDYVTRVIYSGAVQDGATVSFFKDGLEKPPDIFGAEQRKITGEMVALARDVVTRLCFAIMNPNSAVLRVTPNQPGRSVQWRQAREHYLVLTRPQAQRLQKRGTGASDHDIERAAHWRRAHLRRLVSDRYKGKKGQLVFVKQAWIGPDEWQGSDGKIYKVIHTPTK